MSRTIYKTKGKNKVPDFESSNDLIIAKINKDFYGFESTEIKRKDTSVPNFLGNKESGQNSIIYTKNFYKTLHIYKVLLKIEISLLGGDDVKNYNVSIDHLRRAISKRSFRILRKFTNTKCFPIADFLLLSISVRETLNRCSRTEAQFCFISENFIYTFRIPFYKPDIRQDIYNGEEVSIPLLPYHLKNGITI
ncbi:hypothetical protein MTO98_07170 [Mucilaginibacter sp. SMC90]|uniref:hypothetical protein n=1 Tax=Mucilaginibacter sp. SMC90 TaxID=2929803 RepID=UPI001FB3A3B3|nr:hypothetical protein [Mucilaginibacter sp. SMC90]UOE50856.1 hypothetical protein MTO98_07170 [Mucilaginibacter sp. SMC90]